MLDPDEKEKLRPYYFRTIKRLGWTIVYDANKKLDDSLLDLKLMLTKQDKDEDTNEMKTYYGFLEVPYTSNCSYEKFGDQRLHPDDGKFAELVNELDSMIYPYDLDDVVCQLLHLGHSITEIYTVQNGKLALKLNPKIIKELISDFVRKGSPLLNNENLRKPHKIKGRKPVKTFYNVDIFGKRS